MTSRERILKTISHEEPDRVPRDLGGTESSGMTAYALHNLQSHLRMAQDSRVFEPYQYVAYVGNDLKARFGIDTANLTPGPKAWIRRANPLGFDVLLPQEWHEEAGDDGETVVRRSDGTVSARRPKGGYYFDPVNPPLQEASSVAELEQHRATISSFDYPSFADETLDALHERMQLMHARGDCVVLNLCCHILAAGQHLRGYERFMIDLMTDEPMVRRLLDILVEGYCDRVDRLAPVLATGVDVVLLNDDLGTQNAPMIAPSVYRQMIKPYQKELFEYVKRSFAAPILFHSCGAVRDFIPDLIEVGVDALNPIQVNANDMNPAALKRDFGDEIAFWGGGVDTQTVLNSGSPSEVMDAVMHSVDTLAPGGGFVFCQVHNIQPDVPPENVVAMFEALDRYGGY